MSADQDRAGWLSVEAAAARLGVSPATVKRRIQDGKPVRVAGNRSVEIDWEMVERPQGHEWQVRIRGEPPPSTTVQPQPDQEAPRIAQEGSEAFTVVREAWAEDRALLGTLRAENGALRERVGRAEGERDRLAAHLADAQAEREALRARAEAAEQRLAARRWWWPW